MKRTLAAFSISCSSRRSLVGARRPDRLTEALERPTTRPMGAARDLYGLRKDMMEFPVEIGLNPIRVDGRFLVITSVIDITERKRNEKRVFFARPSLRRLVLRDYDAEARSLSSMVIERAS